jgi:hypothetical protein
MLLYGEFLVAGPYVGDYLVQARLKSMLSPRLGFIELGFRNANRTPSYIYGSGSSFPVKSTASLNRENITNLYGLLEVPRLRMTLRGDYFLLSNYTYFSSFDDVAQESAVSNLLRFGVNKEFRLGKSWRWYADLYVQLANSGAPINLPLVFTRNRFAYEGKMFRNLSLSTGFDIRYHTPYKADNYSPVLGQYFLQNDQLISNRPDIAAYLNFRIMRFTAYTRLENLNSLTFKYGFGFKNDNLAAPLYAYQGLLFRLGIFWTFVN